MSGTDNVFAAGGGASSNIRVCVRVRPFNKREIDLGDQLCVSMPSPTQVCISDGGQSKDFEFDRAYWSHDPKSPNFSTQQTLMDEIGQGMKRNTFEGFNNCLFAYGQTGSGKTFSVLGSDSPPEMQGLLPRIVKDLFVTMDEESRDTTCKITFECHVSYLEIYNEQIQDLLLPPQERSNKKLEVHQYPKVGTIIPGLTESAVTQASEVQGLIDFGAKTRSVAATSMNATSSRSHCIFTFQMLRKKTSDGVKSELRSKLNLVDLAGSERQAKTEASGDRLKEGAMINQSLTNLAMVIHKLAELSDNPTAKGTSKKKDFVPFRNSKLTFILTESLSGNSQTVMMAALSPASSNSDETLGTLRFAQSVKTIKTKARKNEESNASIIKELRAECERLKAQMQNGGGSAEEGEAQKHLEILTEKYGMDFEDKVEEAKRMADTRAAALADLGLSDAEILQSMGMDENAPHLLNLSDDPSLSGTLMYFLPEGKTTAMGSGSSCQIKLSGLGMKDNMCTVRNESNVQLFMESQDGRVLLNGRALTDGSSVELQHRDRVILGHAYCFRVVIPKFAAEHAEELHKDHEALENALGEVIPESSPEYQQVHFFVEELADRIGQVKANSFMQAFTKAAAQVEEANTITQEVRPDDQYSLRLEILSNIFTYQSSGPDCVVKLSKADGGLQGDKPESKTIAIWDMAQFGQRIEHMREVFEKFHNEGSSALDFSSPELDPWFQANPWDVGHALHCKTVDHDETIHSMERETALQSQTEDLQRKLAERDSKICDLEAKLRAMAHLESNSKRLNQEDVGLPLNHRMHKVWAGTTAAASLAAKLVADLQSIKQDLAVPPKD